MPAELNRGDPSRRPGSARALDLGAIGQGLERASDGIWYGGAPEQVSFPAEGHERCFAVEEGSFWFRHRNACILAAVRSHPPPGGGAIFDVGGGNGFVSKALAEVGFDVVLVEPGRAGAMHASRRGVENVVCATLEQARFATGSLPACGLFDVLEHIRDDGAFLRTLRSLLAPGGRLYATVPAYSWLWSHEDELAGHFRRYSARRLARSLEAAGLEVAFESYFFRWLPAAILVLRSMPYRFGFGSDRIDPRTVRRDHGLTSGLASRLIEPLLRSEVGLLARGRRMRFGASCLVVGTRPG